MSFHPNLSPPPIPAWNAAHPMLVHLPIGVLLAVPVFLLFTLCAKRMRQPFAFMTLLLLLIGTGGAALAVLSGEEASHAAVVVGKGGQVLDEHEEMGELARNIFVVLSAIYAVIFIAAVAMGEKLGRKVWIATHIIFMLLTAFGLLQLAHAGHLGGRLVHEFGVRAPIGGPPMMMPGEVEEETE